MHHAVATRLFSLMGPAVLATACVDYTVKGGDPPAHFESGVETSEAPPDDTAPPPDSGPPRVLEDCNGLDDDADGDVDEGFPDTDADGAADCIDEECSVVLAEAGAASGERSCGSGAATTGPEDLEHAWSYDPDTVCDQIAVADLDGDGTAEIVCPRYGLDVVDGATGVEEWRLVDNDGGLGPIAMGDVDGDGRIDIVTQDGLGSVKAFDATGALLWASVPLASTPVARPTGIEVVDIDGDGVAEVVTADGAVDGRDGALRGTWDCAASTHNYDVPIAVGDVDGNGIQDVITGYRRFEAGSLIWEADTWPNGTRIVSPVLIQADADDDAEVAFVYDEGLLVVDTDGTLLVRADAPDDMSFGFACAGDLDGDGRSEIVAHNQTSMWAWALDGTVIWSQAITDTSTWTGCSVFDFDADGVYDVLYADEQSMMVLDGRTGAVLAQDSEHKSGTAGEVPAAVDLDGDGSAEIVAPSHGGSGEDRGAIDMYRSSSTSWGPGSTMWASATWSGTAIRPDGSVPRYPARPWLEYGIWRGQPNDPVFGADLAVTITDECLDACTGGTAHVAVQVSNLGPEGAPADTPIAVYTLSADGTRTFSSTFELGEILWPGQAAAGVEITLPVTAVLNGVVVVAGDDGSGSVWSVPDCDATNSEATWVPSCP